MIKKSLIKKNIIKNLTQSILDNLIVDLDLKLHTNINLILDFNNLLSKSFLVKKANILIVKNAHKKETIFFTFKEGQFNLHISNHFIENTYLIRVLSVMIHEYVHYLQILTYKSVEFGYEKYFYNSIEFANIYKKNKYEKEAYKIQYYITNYIYYLILKETYRNRNFEVIKNKVLELKGKDKYRYNWFREIN